MGKILITGAAGFIGFHLCKRFLENSKHRIIGIDNLNNYYSVNLKKQRLKKLKKIRLKFSKGIRLLIHLDIKELTKFQ